MRRAVGDEHGECAEEPVDVVCGGAGAEARAHPFFDRVATRANGLRASLGAGSSAADVDRFLEALGRLIADGPVHAYERTPEGWCPVADDRPRVSFA